MNQYFSILIRLFLIFFTATNVYPQFENIYFEEINSAPSNFEIAILYDSTALDSLLVAQMVQNQIPGLATCIVKNDRIIWNRCYGYANIEKNLTVNDSTSFLLASVTKTITVTALMQLWEQGLFGLDDNINDYLPQGVSVINPYYPEKAITFRMLLTHTSSIKYNYVKSYLPLRTWGEDSPISLDSFVVNYFTPSGTYYDSTNYNNWAPDTSYEYSNEALDLVGYLAGIIADTSFFKYCEDNIFNTLNMKHTAWLLNELDTNNLAMPYIYQFRTFYPLGYYSNPGYCSALLKSSSSDLAHFLIMYINKGEINDLRILDNGTVTIMNTVHFPSIAPNIGLVWLLEYQGRSKVWWHRGGYDGCSTWISYNPVEKFGVVILSNMSQGMTNLDTIYNALYQFGLSSPTGIGIANKPATAIFLLRQNYPNPFNNSTMINYQLPRTCEVALSIYNTLGQKVATLVAEKQRAGSYKVEWDASKIASGVYLYRIEAGNFTDVRKMIIMK